MKHEHFDESFQYSTLFFKLIILTDNLINSLDVGEVDTACLSASGINRSQAVIEEKNP